MRKPRKVYQMGWKEVQDRLQRTGIDQHGLKVFGVPQGGVSMCAGLLKSEVVFDATDADMIVDDIIDSGRTRKFWTGFFPNTPFKAIVNKLDVPEDRKLGWVVFPWENQTLDPVTGDGGGPEDAVERLLQFIGEDPRRDGLRETPRRVLKALKEMTQGYDQDPEEVLSKQFDSSYDQMIVVAGIRFTSLCEHHLLPFMGTAAVGYIPNTGLVSTTKGTPMLYTHPRGKVVGLSKLARVVQVFAKRLQIQEQMTDQIANAIQGALGALGVGVIVRAKHSCMGCRGVVQPDADMVTSCLLGRFRQPEVRAEFLDLVRG